MKIFTEVQELRENKEKYALFLDNAPIHHSKIVKLFLIKIYGPVLFQAPYVPFDNPIEELFGTWKMAYWKMIFDENETVVQKIVDSCNKTEEILMYSICLYSLEFFTDSLDKKPIE